MDINQIEEASKFITDESMIQFKNGKIIKGATEITTIILKCCEEYNQGYIESMKRRAALYSGCTLLGLSIGVISAISTKKLIDKRNSKKEQH